MQVSVFFTSAEVKPSDTAGKLVAVIDVLRASTTVAVALANGAKTVIPLEGVDEVTTRAKTFERSEVRMAGERQMVHIAGFDLGNSPLEFTQEAVEGKTVLLTTTNGTRALMGVQGARDIVVASYVNFSAVLTMMKVAARTNTDIAIICAGHEGNFSIEDASCAGRYVRAIPRRAEAVVMNDAASASVVIDRKYGDNLAKIFKDSSHGQALEAAGFAGDLVAAAAVDSHSVVPIYQDRQITKLGPERER